MVKLLNLKTSLFGDGSVSNELITEFLQQLSSNGLVLETVTRDLSKNPIPHLDSDWLTAISAPVEDLSEEQLTKVEFSNSLISELQVAELVVIGAPMYNFTIPSVLKAWVDQVARAGVTFKYTDTGSVGLLQNKQVVVMATMGGFHETGKSDHLSPYLKTMLGFLGLTNVEIVIAPGLNMGAEQRQVGLLSAKTKIAEIVNQFKQSQTAEELDKEAA